MAESPASLTGPGDGHGCEWTRFCWALRSVLGSAVESLHSYLLQLMQIIQRILFSFSSCQGGVVKVKARKGLCPEPPSQCHVGWQSPGMTSVTHVCPTWWAMCSAAGLWRLQDPPCLEECGSADLAVWVGAGPQLQGRGQEPQRLSCGGAFQPHSPELLLLSPNHKGSVILLTLKVNIWQHLQSPK